MENKKNLIVFLIVLGIIVISFMLFEVYVVECEEYNINHTYKYGKYMYNESGKFMFVLQDDGSYIVTSELFSEGRGKYAKPSCRIGGFED